MSPWKWPSRPPNVVVEFPRKGSVTVGSCDSGAFEYLGCPKLLLANEDLFTQETFESCEIQVGPGYVVRGPGGDLTLVAGSRARFLNGFWVESGGSLEVRMDPALQLVLPELVALERARRQRDGPPP